jgi:hypothetical protein
MERGKKLRETVMAGHHAPSPWFLCTIAREDMRGSIFAFVPEAGVRRGEKRLDPHMWADAHLNPVLSQLPRH